MTSKSTDGAELDELLKRALTDDLPPDVAAGMGRRLALFHRTMTRKKERTPVWAALFPRSAWAVLSVLVLVSGGLLQGRGTRNPLSGRISLIKTRLAVSEQLAAAGSMICSARVRSGDGAVIDYEIAWRSGSAAEVLVKGPDGSLSGRFRLGEPCDASEARFSKIALLASPSAVAGRLSGDWRSLGSSRIDGCEFGTYSILAEAGSEAIDFTVDMCTCLPVRISGASWEATLRF